MVVTVSSQTQRTLKPYWLDYHSLMLARRDDGVWANVPCLVVHHSPDGFEYGYAGSGPADLALNILEHYFREHPLEDPLPGEVVPVWGGGSAKRIAWLLHQDVKADLIASLPHGEQEISVGIEPIEQWIELRLQLEMLRLKLDQNVRDQVSYEIVRKRQRRAQG